MSELKIWIQIKIKVEQRLRGVVLHRPIWIGHLSPMRIWRWRWRYGDDNYMRNQWMKRLEGTLMPANRVGLSQRTERFLGIGDVPDAFSPRLEREGKRSGGAG